jgi:hypothetical protein
VIDRMRRVLNVRIGHARAGVDADGHTPAAARTEREIRRDVIAAENAELSRLYAEGMINDTVRQRLQRQLDLELARFSDEPH